MTHFPLFGHSMDTDKKMEEGGGTIEEIDMSNEIYDVPLRETPVKLKGRYLQGEILGRGMTAEVIEVLDLQTLRRKVVKKFLVKHRRSEDLDSNDTHKKISDEYYTLRRLNHANIIKAYEMFQEDDGHILFVVTEYCCGSLEELRLSRPDHKIAINNCHFYFHQLIDGVEYLHSHSLVHYDIKPDNLMINNDNTLKIADFGSCITLDIFTSEIRSGDANGGSRYFQPPEILKPIDIDEKVEELTDRMRADMLRASDVWSCGIVLYMSACGHHPFPESVDAFIVDLYNRIIEKRFESNEVLQKNRALDFLLDKILHIDWRKRATITEIKRDVWYNISMNPSHFAGIPARKKQSKRLGDKYRSMTVTPALNQMLRPIHRTVKVKDEDLDNFKDQKEMPIVRPNRSPEPVRSPPISLFKQAKIKYETLKRRF